MLAHLYRRFPGISSAAAIRALFDDHLVPELIAAECNYLQRASASGFERPYGWAWLLKLAEALIPFPDLRCYGTLAPLAGIFVERFEDFLPKATYPVRVGTHFNTAFALALGADYAVATGDARFAGMLRAAAEGWYGSDADCQAWEPCGDDFLSSALIEAECMRRLTPAPKFLEWFDRFLPGLTEGRPASLFVPASVSDRTDGKIAHLDGLNLSRAWCWRSLADALPEGDARRARMLAAAEAHLHAGLPHVTGHYMGEHWLATFAVLALDH
jgi:hypothetical protein